MLRLLAQLKQKITQTRPGKTKVTTGVKIGGKNMLSIIIFSNGLVEILQNI